jgi:hypothetical protein
MSYTTSKWIEAGVTALAIQVDGAGHARFVLHRRIPDSPTEPRWEPIHVSGLYPDAAAAEADGVRQRDRLRRKAFAAMTVNERLSYAGLMPRWELAIRSGSRQDLLSILAEVDLADQANAIADAAMSTQEGRKPF